MKLKIYSMIAVGALAMTFISCKKEFLDKQPFGNQATPDVAFADAAAAEKLLQGAYDGMYNEYHIMDFLTNGDAIADNCYAGGDNPANIQLDKFTVTNTNANVTRDWTQLYKDIKNCNLITDNVPGIEDATLDIGDRRKQILAEARILRGYMYFNLVRLWGSVPLVTKIPTTTAEFQPPKASVDAIYAQIIADLEYGVANAKTTSANKGIVTKGVANALLAKVYATKPNADWSKVLEYTNATIANGYSLIGYDQLWDSQHDNNSEAIWEMQYDGWGGLHGNWMPSQLFGAGWKKFNTPTNDLIATYDAEGDVVRKASSILYDGIGWDDDYWKVAAQYPHIRKYRADDKSDTYIIRLADILLLKAEAQNELSTTGWSQAKTIVDQIRLRVNLGATPAASQAAMRLALEKERRLELAFEGHRWFDLLRTNRAITVMNAQTANGVNLNYNVTAAKLLLPIPQTEIDRNQNLR
ncbi:RagB/SusD family nutrient uptake outer membrane protein [Pedobacter sp. MC2016-14]|uniref:RagB/SusD family nutrient uptake outer membrane protein n=1 Tax=Pedobacter sp. MC2016-14 TaxID=2897327 RepID=UPI001E5EB272|nr:RagB/SusD family nutrient uptake outer membrane protein [Pedobacter sp. MC2016-14]MCD0488220.1 RagB/SusD family nutrient uptake outer membrane protein [Pedobacter sp. MC2016-14]